MRFLATKPLLFAGSGSAAEAVVAPAGVSESISGNVFIGDTGNNRILKKLITSGRVASIVGQPGSDTGQFLQPIGVR